MRSSSSLDLDNGGSSNDAVISSLALAVGEDNIALSSNALGNSDLVSAGDMGGINPDGASRADESSVEGSAEGHVALSSEQDLVVDLE